MVSSYDFPRDSDRTLVAMVVKMIYL